MRQRAASEALITLILTGGTRFGFRFAMHVKGVSFPVHPEVFDLAQPRAASRAISTMRCLLGVQRGVPRTQRDAHRVVA